MTTLLDHNQKTYDEVKDFINKGLNCCVVNPCGSGKTSIMSKILEDNPDASFTIITKQKNAENYYKNKNKVFSRDNVGIYTYNKMYNDYKADKIDVYNTDFMLIDEAHYIGASLWTKAFSTIVDKYNQRLIGFTATPQRYEDQGTNNNIVTDFFEGNVAGNFTTKDLQNSGIFVEPEYILSIYNLKTIIDDRLNKVYDSNIEDKEKDKLISKLNSIYEKWMNESNPAKVLSENLPKFMYREKCNKILVYIEDMKHLSEKKKYIETIIKNIFQDKSVVSYTYTYKTSEDELRKFLKDDKRVDIKILFSIDKIMETIHIEDLRIMIMLRPSISARIITQQFGRVNNITNKNKPLIIDMVDNLSNLHEISFIKRTKANKEYTDSSAIKKIYIPHVTYYNCIFEKVDKQLSRFKYYTYKGFTGSLIDICDIYCKNVDSVSKLMKTYSLEDAIELATNKKRNITQAIFDDKSSETDFVLTDEQKIWSEKNINIVNSFFERRNITNDDWKQELYICYLYIISKFYDEPGLLHQRIVNKLKTTYIILYRRSIIRENIFESINSHQELQMYDGDSEYLFNNSAYNELKRISYELMDTLTDREKCVVMKRYGFFDGVPYTYREIGEMGISNCWRGWKKDHVCATRIAQIEANALRKLRHPTRTKRIKDFLD